MYNNQFWSQIDYKNFSQELIKNKIWKKMDKKNDFKNGLFQKGLFCIFAIQCVQSELLLSKSNSTEWLIYRSKDLVGFQQRNRCNRYENFQIYLKLAKWLEFSLSLIISWKSYHLLVKLQVSLKNFFLTLSIDNWKIPYLNMLTNQRDQDPRWKTTIEDQIPKT